MALSTCNYFPESMTCRIFIKLIAVHVWEINQAEIRNLSLCTHLAHVVVRVGAGVVVEGCEWGSLLQSHLHAVLHALQIVGLSQHPVDGGAAEGDVRRAPPELQVAALLARRRPVRSARQTQWIWKWNRFNWFYRGFWCVQVYALKVLAMQLFSAADSMATEVMPMEQQCMLASVEPTWRIL